MLVAVVGMERSALTGQAAVPSPANTLRRAATTKVEAKRMQVRTATPPKLVRVTANDKEAMTRVEVRPIRTILLAADTQQTRTVKGKPFDGHFRRSFE